MVANAGAGGKIVGIFLLKIFVTLLRCCVVCVLEFNGWDDFGCEAQEKGLVALLLLLRVLVCCCLDIFLLLVFAFIMLA